MQPGCRNKLIIFFADYRRPGSRAPLRLHDAEKSGAPTPVLSLRNFAKKSPGRYRPRLGVL
ncbi:hypothetical protein C2U68_05235 [Methylomonas koyamae]|nr:hypothetical protein C2U68_05235 [Methylomonas koyamae]